MSARERVADLMPTHKYVKRRSLFVRECATGGKDRERKKSKQPRALHIDVSNKAFGEMGFSPLNFAQDKIHEY